MGRDIETNHLVAWPQKDDSCAITDNIFALLHSYTTLQVVHIKKDNSTTTGADPEIEEGGAYM